jgi:alpha-1,2-mannosyltransferase
MARRHFWSISRGEVRVVLATVAVALWALTLRVWLEAPIPCGDFVCPYTMGTLALHPERLYDVDAFHAQQSALVPASSALFYPPVYPPQLALLMAPISRLPFAVAVTLWSVTMAGVYAAVLRSAYQRLNLLVEEPTVALMALSFPPFIEMVQYGQNTALLLGACFLAWRALERGRPLVAGAALGLLALKPQLGLPFAVIVVAGREWRLLAGAACSIAAQAVAVWSVMGAAAFTAFWKLVPDIVANVNALEDAPERVHSIRSITRLLPGSLGWALWFGAAAIDLWGVAAVWRSPAPVRVRLAFAILAALLVSPHLITYELTLLALPLLLIASWEQERGSLLAYLPAIALLFVSLAIPWETLTRIQPSVLVMLWIAYRTWASTRVPTWTRLEPSAI